MISLLVQTMRRAVFCLLLCFSVFPPSARGAEVPTKERPFVLVIDPGHGGKDAGAVGTFAKEKNINLNVALAFGALVEANCPDVKVVFTRKTDIFVTLQGRADIANRNKADLFVSIHTNAVERGKHLVRGAETYTLGMHRAAKNLEVAKRENSVITQESNYRQVYQNFDPKKAESYIIFEFLQDRNMQQSVDFARKVQQQYAKQGRLDKGVHQAGFLVLHATSMPSVLTELGFISHPEEERYLASDKGVQQLAQSLYEGFKAYRRPHAPRLTDAAPDLSLLPPLAAPLAPTSHPQESALTDAAPGADGTSAPRLDTPPADTVRLSMAPSPSLSSLHAEVVEVETRPFRPAATLPAPAPADPPAPPAPQPATPPANASLADAVRQTRSTIAALETAPPSVPKPQEKAPSAKPKPQPVAATEAPQLPKATTKKKSDSSVPAATTVEKKPAGSTIPTPADPARPVFKVQVLTSDRQLSPTDAAFKGLTPIEVYRDGGKYKYTFGKADRLAEAQQLRKTAAAQFPQAFIVAFENEQRVELQQAIQHSQTSVAAPSSTPTPPKRTKRK